MASQSQVHAGETLERVRCALERVQGERLVLLGQVWLSLQPEALALAQLDNPVSSVMFNDWWVSFPEAMVLLLRALRACPASLSLLLRLSASEHVLPALRDEARDHLAARLDTLSEAERAVLAVPTGEDRVPRWPHTQNFPALDTLAGRQARLLYLGFSIEDPLGTWGVSSQAALIRYQIDAELPGLGDWSPETAAALDGEASGWMCMNRDDPSTVFS